MRYACAILCLFVTGCGTIPPETQTVNVPITVRCQAVEPDRPSMPTESLVTGDTQDTKIAAALAEIDIREGYELRLVTALRSCK